MCVDIISNILNLLHQFSFIAIVVYFQCQVPIVSFVLEKGLVASLELFCGGDYAPSIGHANKPLHLIYTERLEESDGEEGAGRNVGRVERRRGVFLTVSFELF